MNASVRAVSLSDAVRRIRSALTPLHPRGRSWLRFLESMELDPDELPRPLPAPGPRDFIICGLPRSGTTLLSAMLVQPPRITTAVEPWVGMQLPPRELFETLREEIAQGGGLARGKLDVAALRQRGAVERHGDGDRVEAMDLDEDYSLGVKWPEYWKYLGLLPTTKFLVCVRHPVDVIASFKRLGGRLGLGLGYDIAFNRRLNDDLTRATSNIALRRVLLYDRIVSHILPHVAAPHVFLVRYERWFEDPEAMMNEMGAFLGHEPSPMPATIRSRGRRPTLEPVEMKMLARHFAGAAELGYSL